MQGQKSYSTDPQFDAECTYGSPQWKCSQQVTIFIYPGSNTHTPHSGRLQMHFHGLWAKWSELSPVCGSCWQGRNPPLHVAEDFSLALSSSLAPSVKGTAQAQPRLALPWHCHGNVHNPKGWAGASVVPCVWVAPVPGTHTAVLLAAALPACAHWKCRAVEPHGICTSLWLDISNLGAAWF